MTHYVDRSEKLQKEARNFGFGPFAFAERLYG